MVLTRGGSPRDLDAMRRDRVAEPIERAPLEPEWPEIADPQAGPAGVDPE